MFQSSRRLYPQRVWYVLQCPHLTDILRMLISSAMRCPPGLRSGRTAPLFDPAMIPRDPSGGPHFAKIPGVMEERHRSLRCFVLLAPLLAVLLAVAPLPADQGTSPQDPQADPSAAFTEEVSVGYVLVPVVVRSGARYIKNLDKGDFRLLVDNRPVSIESFEYRSEAPASVMVLQDLSGSMEGKSLDLSREAVCFFLGKALPGDEYAIATFASGSTQVEVPFTSELPALQEAVRLWKAWGTTALHDAVTTVPNLSQSGKNPKRFAILLTDGVDNASKITPERARELVRQAQVPVYVLGMSTGDPFEITEEGKKIYRYADVLNLLATT